MTAESPEAYQLLVKLAKESRDNSIYGIPKVADPLKIIVAQSM